jgi:hypothetical protein
VNTLFGYRAIVVSSHNVESFTYPSIDGLHPVPAPSTPAMYVLEPRVTAVLQSFGSEALKRLLDRAFLTVRSVNLTMQSFEA